MVKNKISCVIIDDEPFARKGLGGYIEKIDFLNLIGICENALELNSLLKQHHVDLIFLDIEMPQLTGIEFLQNAADHPKVILTTAYEQYALKGYELDVLDYLLKPISFDRFLKAANKAYDWFCSQGSGEKGFDYIFVKSDNKLERVNFDEIFFVEALENYVAIYTGDKKIITHLTLKALIERLPVNGFISPHKSYVVAVDKITAIEGNMLLLSQYQVPVSKYQKDDVMEKIINNKLLKR
ncbi:MAG: DNA-binding response regulator [Bacteroidetes bacterium]|nr:MAG: DNA-binding response regulator [Bacteroidota bacterium]